MHMDRSFLLVAPQASNEFERWHANGQAFQVPNCSIWLCYWICFAKISTWLYYRIAGNFSIVWLWRKQNPLTVLWMNSSNSVVRLRSSDLREEYEGKRCNKGEGKIASYVNSMFSDTFYKMLRKSSTQTPCSVIQKNNWTLNPTALIFAQIANFGISYPVLYGCPIVSGTNLKNSQSWI